MKHLLILLAAASLPLPIAAGELTVDAYRLADAFAESAWASMEQSTPTLVAGMESQLRSSGATEKASKALAEEVRRSLSRDNVVKALAQVMSDRLTPEELVQLNQFMQSGLGKKYLQLSKDIATDAKYIAPILRQACNDAGAQLSAFDRGSINGVCRNF